MIHFNFVFHGPVILLFFGKCSWQLLIDPPIDGNSTHNLASENSAVKLSQGSHCTSKNNYIHHIGKLINELASWSATNHLPINTEGAGSCLAASRMCSTTT